MRRSIASLLIGLGAVVACGSSSSPGSAGPGDGGATPAPDGGGVCCPIASDPCFACGGPSGGWAASASQCSGNGPCDGWLGKGVDAHGCAVITTGAGATGAVCCGCPPASDGGHGGDGGDGGGADAPGDAAPACPASPPSIGSSCSSLLSCSYCDGGALCDCNAGAWECGGSTSCFAGGGGG
jgi:hypothetical protein